MLYEKLGSLALYIKPEVLNLCELCFNLHVNAVMKVAFYHLRNITKVQPFLFQSGVQIYTDAT